MARVGSEQEQVPVMFDPGVPEFSAGVLRALAWVSERHPSSGVAVVEHRDRAQVGWTVARVLDSKRGRRTERHYWCSPTGRVFAGSMEWAGGSVRSDVVLRDADYDDPSRQPRVAYRQPTGWTW